MGFFTDRHLGQVPRVETELPEALIAGIIGHIRNRAADGSFGMAYPDPCPDGLGPIGTDTTALRAALRGYRVLDPFERGAPAPTTMEVLDLIEFAYDKIAEPQQGSPHRFFGHNHLEFDQDAGQTRFIEEINLMFAGNGIAFELMGTGQVERIALEGIREALSQAVFRTGDNPLDQLLERARTKFLNRDSAVRRES